MTGGQIAQVVQPSLATLTSLDDNTTFEFPFNPKDNLKLGRTIAWREAGTGGPSGGGLTYVNNSADTLEINLLLDETVADPIDLENSDDFVKRLVKNAAAVFFSVSPNTESITENLKTLYDFTMPTVEDKSTYQFRPHLLEFAWPDSDFNFVGTISSFSSDILLIDADGNPKRAEVSMTLEGRAFVLNATPEDFFLDKA